MPCPVAQQLQTVGAEALSRAEKNEGGFACHTVTELALETLAPKIAEDFDRLAAVYRCLTGRDVDIRISERARPVSRHEVRTGVEHFIAIRSEDECFDEELIVGLRQAAILGRPAVNDKPVVELSTRRDPTSIP